MEADLLLCTEEELEGEEVTVMVTPADAREAFSMLLEQETREGRLARNPTYLADVQRHGMSAAWRRLICKWMFETGSAFKLAEDTVGTAVFFMDQFLSRTSVDKVLLQLLSMVALYVASKMHESQPISMDEMDMLSQRKFSRREVCELEAELVTALAWRLAPPVAFTFARDFIRTLDVPDHQAVLEDETFTFLVAVTADINSLQFKSSSVGISAVRVIWNARRLRPSSVLKDAISALDLDTVEFVNCYRWLLELYHSQHEQQPFISVDGSKVDDPRSISPTSVDEVATTRHSAAAASADPVGDAAKTAAATQAPSAKRRLEASPDCAATASDNKKARCHPRV